jgi:HPt (histidine-containing phosphotransfer) domain-containing protein
MYYSHMAGDPELAELVRLFVQELVERLAKMSEAARAGDWQQLGRLAHQLKGAGGSHGFPQLTTPASELEIAARSTAPEAVAEALHRLIEACGRVRAGLPDPVAV